MIRSDLSYPAFIIGLSLATPALAGAPLNNSCGQAINVGTGVFEFDTTGATTSVATACDPGPLGDDLVHNNVWYRFAATCTGVMTITTCGTADFNTRIAVYEGPDCSFAPGVAVGCNDDDPVNACGLAPDFHSTLTVPIVDGEVYLISIGSFMEGETGSGMFEITAPTAGPPTLLLRREPGPELEINDKVIVNLWATGLCTDAAAGFQAFLEFDDLRLMFDAGGSSYTDDPFGLHVLSPITAVGNQINLAAGIDQPAQGETNDDVLLARLSFIALEPQCFPEVSFRSSKPPSRLTDIGGNELLPLQLVNSGPTCPSDTDGNNAVDVDDIIAVIINWNTDECTADVDNSGIVDVDDLVQVILDFGPCP